MSGDSSDSNSSRWATANEVVDSRGVDTKVRSNSQVNIAAQICGVCRRGVVVTKLETVHGSREISQQCSVGSIEVKTKDRSPADNVGCLRCTDADTGKWSDGLERFQGIADFSQIEVVVAELQRILSSLKLRDEISCLWRQCCWHSCVHSLTFGVSLPNSLWLMDGMIVLPALWNREVAIKVVCCLWSLRRCGGRNLDCSLVHRSSGILVSSNLSSGENHVGLYALDLLDGQGRGMNLSSEGTLLQISLCSSRQECCNHTQKRWDSRGHL